LQYSSGYGINYKVLGRIMVRCNMCEAEYTDDVIECADCYTDAYLMEVK
jgi:hypothetical protein